jgi:wyosine [tRNA(Phe)-imidazoG37] synthetase (radical SAM superfamily)
MSKRTHRKRDKTKYLYGPVPSRRLGRSLGVDIVPAKVCTLDCVYCQIGRTTDKSVERKDYTDIEAILTELKERLSGGLKADFITISGSGEPTLHSQLGELIDGIKKITDIPVALITNGTLLDRPDVRADCSKADVVLPSLDAGDEQTFQRINRPHNNISIEKLISGLCAFRNEYTGQIWLEVFFVEGMNTDSEQISKIKDAIERISPDKVQLNTAVRPTSVPNIRSVAADKLRSIAGRLGVKCEVVADYLPRHLDEHFESKAEDVLSMLKRRPCTLDDVCGGLNISRNEALKYITHLKQQSVIDSEEKGGAIFFKINPASKE